MTSITAAVRQPRTELWLRVLLYAAILTALLWNYSAGADSGAQFVYTNF